MATSLVSNRGVSLVETLIATALLVTALVGVGELLVSSARFLLDSGRAAAALTAAQSQIEALRGREWIYNASGAAIGDRSLNPSPRDALSRDVEGYADYLDSAGRNVDADEAVFVRRWAITPLSEEPPDALLVEVCVFRRLADRATLSSAEACLSTVRTRQP